jgi:hypothetical protein
MSRSTDLDPLLRKFVASISNNNRTAATGILGDPPLRNASLTSPTDDASHNSLTDTTLTSLTDAILRGLVQPPSVSLMTEAIRQTAINQQSEQQQQQQQQLLRQILPNVPSFLHSWLDPSTVASMLEELQDANGLLLALQALASANDSYPHVFVSNDPSATSSISSGNSSGNNSSGNSSGNSTDNSTGNSTVSRISESSAANSIPSLESNSSIAHVSHHSYLTQATLEVIAKQALLNGQSTTNQNNQNWPRKRQKTSADQNNNYDYQEEKWDAQFNELLAFKAQHGHCRVPQNYESNPALSHWVKRQRYQYKCKREGKVSGISESRIQKLEQIGFVWDAQELLWQTRFDELKVYRLKHGHCNVPYNYDVNRKLPTWIKCQRRQYKLRHEEQPSNMTQERIDLLHGLEFKWGQRESTVADR